MSGPSVRKIDVSKDKNREKEIKSVKKGGKETEFVCTGMGLTVRATTTRRRQEERLPDGTSKWHNIPAKCLDFVNGTARTNDEELIEGIKLQPGWGVDYFYHPEYLPKDASDADKQAARRIAGAHKELIEDHQRRIEAAKYFDKAAHPEDGVHGFIDEDNPDPDMFNGPYTGKGDIDTTAVD